MSILRLMHYSPKKVNSQRGAIGFLVVLLAVAVSAIAITVLVGINRRSEQVATDVDKDVLTQIASQEAANIIGNLPSGLTYQGILSGFNQNNDQGVSFYLPAGETVELDPTVNEYCKTNSCVIKIWWHNDATKKTCAEQASLLISEYSQDANQENWKNDVGFTTEENQSRNGQPKERTRYYLFRPYVCATNAEGIKNDGLDWAGYETAFGPFGTNEERKILSVYSIDDTTANCTGENGANCYSGSVGEVTKKRQEFRYNQELSKSFANYYEIPVWPNTTVVRIKALYADTVILVDLPGQIVNGTSTTTYPDGTSATVNVTKTLEQIPSVFDFALFAGDGVIQKNNESAE